LVVTGYAWNVLNELTGGLTKSDALSGSPVGDTTGGGSDNSVASGPMNLLVMGLDSRLDQHGNPLPAAVLEQLHAGDSGNGGYNSNVLMLVHLPAPGEGGGPVVISIPRDDYVNLPGRPSGVDKAKIKEGYGLAKVAAEDKLRANGLTDRAQLEQAGREAGRRQTIRSVQDFLGVRIDHFVEVTLVGFYDLAKALGQVTVCLAGPTQDSYSGARFVRGPQQLDAAQALAFVRQRRDYVHPELNFTDLDRARRQQAFLASAAYQLKSAGTLTSPSRLHALIEVAAQDIVIDKGLDLVAFAQQTPALTSGGFNFTTLPVKAFDTIDGQAVNLVDPAQIRTVVHGLIGSDDATGGNPPARLPSATLDITNASGRDGLANTLATALADRGLTRGSMRTNHAPRNHTTLSYNPDSEQAATALAALFTDLTPQPDPTTTPGHLDLVLGTDFTTPTSLQAPADGRATESTDRAGGGVPTSSLRTNAIPCVK
jgi:LCP family protein required for cell wall assembly